MPKIFIVILLIFIIGCDSQNSDNIKKVKTITTIQEASGICYVPKTDTLFVVGDNGIVYEIDKNGLELQRKDLKLAKNDFEGIAYDKQLDLLYIAVEGVDNILVLDRDLNVIKEVNINRQDAKGRVILENKGDGLEGISVYGDKVYVSNQSFKMLPASDPSVLVELNSSWNDRASISRVIEHGYVDISGMAFYNETLYLISDTDNLLIKYDIANSKVISKKSISDIDSTLANLSLEGVAFDNDGYIYFAIDDKKDGKIVKYKYY